MPRKMRDETQISPEKSEIIRVEVDSSSGGQGNGGESPREASALDCWALVELFGRQRIVGRISTQTVGVAALVRVDVPDLTKDGKVVRRGFTRFYGPGAIYSITPVDEAGVRQLLPHISGEPVKDWEYRFGAVRE